MRIALIVASEATFAYAPLLWLESAPQTAELVFDFELFCLERDIPLFGYGSTTVRNEENQRGLEPECYSRDVEKDIPDIALEVVKTPGRIDKLDVSSRLGIREVWVFDTREFRVVSLRTNQYAHIANSEVFPELDLPKLAAFAQRKDQHAALREFRALVGR